MLVLVLAPLLAATPSDLLLCNTFRYTLQLVSYTQQCLHQLLLNQSFAQFPRRRDCASADLAEGGGRSLLDRRL